MIRRTLIIAAVALTFAGCLVGSSTKTTHTGKYVSEKTLAQVKAGDSEASVVALLGEPTSKAARDDGSSIWKWQYSEATTRKGSVFLLIGTESTKETQGAVYVEMKDSKVAKTWRD